ncbi:S8 family serine peptidase [Micromonospora terminaliae]|uniref:alpha-amylase n=1 Tax=Micromonospora terminaliae TaxID=1914461 RepID=A0AAJ2ZDL1_9ACTN|nr:S8 family serine peptidase [Micromonospora terminaliae]NES28195.1 S8 family serine peptidase [Micromonospora terminaliae]QGL47073.1 S8 family serine peptidase [Micromonospora terminaliae]
MRLKALAATLAAAVGLSMIQPVPASAAEPDPGAAAKKIASNLKDRFRTQPTSDFWITFGAKADLAPAKKIANWTERGQFVYDALKAAAKSSAGSVAAELDAAGVKYTSYPLVNAVLVKGGTQKLALDVASVGQVAEIHVAPQVALVEPVEEKTPADQAARSAAPKATAAEGTTTWGLDAIHAPEAWAMGATGAGITVSNLDSGVQFDHPALMHQYRGTKPDGTVDHNYNWMAARGTCTGAPCDDNGHGTHTMGTMVGDDGTNHIGVAPDAQWIATNGCCDSSGVESLLKSGWWLLAPTDVNGNNPDPSKRPHVINNSWGQTVEHNFDDFFQAIDEAWSAAGIFSVWSSGNTTPYAACDTVSSPGSAESAYSVGAYDSDGTLASFSRKGEGEGGRIKPEISAPGVAVRSSYPNNSYVEMAGTSMAAPHVAGAVADLWSYDPTLIGQVEETRRLLADSAVDVDDTECGGTADVNNKYGEGRLDLVRLLELAPRQGGTLTGVVTADGAPVPAAEVTISGPFSRSIGTDKDGRFTTNLPVGTYQLSTKVFGYLTATANVTISLGQDSSVTLPLTAAAKHDISGRVVDDKKRPVPNADVSVKNTPLKPVRTDANGAFTIAGVPEGQYGLAVTPNACLSPTSLPLTVGAENKPLEILVGRVVDKGGYSCDVSEGEYLRGTDQVAFTSGVWATVKLPFPIALYNGSHDTLGISLRGVITPDEGTGPGSGGAGVFPFYVQTPVEFAPGGGVFTAATKVDGEDAFVVEFRNAKIWAWPIRSEYTEPVNFSATLTRSGKIIFGYGDGIGTDDPVTAGAKTITGIQGWAGVDGIRFSDSAPVLHDGMIVTYDLPDWGYLDATVVDKNDGLPVAGAKVSFTNKKGLVEAVTTNGTGIVHRQLPVGDYTMTVDAPNYTTAAYPFSLDKLYANATIDARLTTGVAGLKADGLDALLGTDQNGVGSLTLTNTGSAPLTYDLGEAARHPELDATGATARTGTGAASTIDLAAWKAGASGMKPSNLDGTAATAKAAEAQAAGKVGVTSGGDVITRIAIPGTIQEKEPSGIGYDGDVWVHDYNKRTNTAYTVTGKPTGKVFDASWNPAYRAFDMALDTRTGDMCQMEDSPASYIHCFDRNTGKETRQIKGDWSTLQLTGLAYNPAEDVFYVGGRRNGMIGTVAGTSHDNAGALLSFCAPPLPEVMGLAYNQASDTIWYTDLTSNRPTRLLQVDPDDCSLVNAWWFPGQKAGQGGGLETDSTGALWAADQVADDVVLVDVEDDLLTDLPWLSLSSTGGTLAPGESTTVKVSISSKDAKPGVLGANIVVRSDSGRQSKTYVPVTLTTTKYQVGVNAGGPSFTDGSGYTWSGDQAAGKEAWGYEGKTKVASTTSGIERTTDDALFQSQRTTADRQLFYRFPDAPKGTYAIDLGFAEIEKTAKGKRVFDVLVNGTLTDYAYDAAAAVGPNAADWRTAVVKHEGGPLTVELRGSKGLKAPTIAALRVTLDPRADAAEPEPQPEQPEPGPVPVAPAGRSYSMKVTDGLYRQGTEESGWHGDDVCGVLWFDSSFLFPFYDTAWDGVCVTTNGQLIFDQASAVGGNTELPSPYAFDAIYPLWDDLVVDDEAGIYFGRTEVDGLAAEVIEWRNATFYSDQTARVSFSVTLIADGRIQIGYGDGVGGDNPLTRGSSATVGVESLTHNPAAQYSFNQPILKAGLGLEYTLPAAGTIEGTVTDKNDGKPIEGAIVTLKGPNGERVITADAKGRWKAQALVGENTVQVEAPNYVTASHPVTIARKDQAEVVDTALTTGIATVTGGDLDWLLDKGQEATADVTVTNTGSAPLEVRLSEQKRTSDGGHEAADLPWLTLTGAAATGTVTLAAGESTTVTATADNAGVEPGVLVGDVLVTSNAGKSEAQLKPVRLATSAYWRGVDVGGAGYVGTDGFVWSPDQELGSQPWGYVGGKARTTKADIAGTEEDALFRTQRTGETFSYVFKNAPAGTYRIGLDFAEIENVKAGKRTFDVLADGKVVLYDHDVQAKVGALTADMNTVTVEHAGGDLKIELRREKGESDPILNALKIQEDPRR